MGGSIVSLYQLVKGLDRDFYEPIVVLREGHEAVGQFRELGVDVRMALAGYTGAMAGDAEPFSPLRGSGLAAWLKGTPFGEKLVHTAGFYLRTWPEVRKEAEHLRAIIADVRPDLVHLNDVVGVSRSGILAARETGVSAICHLRAMADRTHYDRWASRSLMGYICISHAVDRHQQGLGGRTTPSWIVYNGVDLAEYRSLPSPREAREALGFQPDDVVIGCVGRLRPWKGQHIYLRALAELVASQPDLRPHLRGLVVGAPERHAQGYREELSTLAHVLGLDDEVTFAGYRTDVPLLLRAMDLMVHASTAPEPFGRVIIESMAAGTPVVATKAGAVPEIIEHRRTGYLVEPGDPTDMARGISYALSIATEREAWRRSALQVVQTKFALAEYVRGVEQVYAQLLPGAVCASVDRAHAGNAQP